MSIIQRIALFFTIVGAINWGLVGFFQFDLVAAIFGDMSIISRIVYSIVGICGLVNIIQLVKVDRREMKYDEQAE